MDSPGSPIVLLSDTDDEVIPMSPRREEIIEISSSDENTDNAKVSVICSPKPRLKRKSLFNNDNNDTENPDSKIHVTTNSDSGGDIDSNICPENEECHCDMDVEHNSNSIPENMDCLSDEDDLQNICTNEMVDSKTGDANSDNDLGSNQECIINLISDEEDTENYETIEILDSECAVNEKVDSETSDHEKVDYETSDSNGEISLCSHQEDMIIINNEDIKSRDISENSNSESNVGKNVNSEISVSLIEECDIDSKNSCVSEIESERDDTESKINNNSNDKIIPTVDEHLK